MDRARPDPTRSSCQSSTADLHSACGAAATSSGTTRRWCRGTREGLQAARARGRSGGRRPKLSAAKAATVRRMYAATGPDGKRLHTVAEIAQTVGVHRTTVYDYLSKEG